MPDEAESSEGQSPASESETPPAPAPESSPSEEPKEPAFPESWKTQIASIIDEKFESLASEDVSEKEEPEPAPPARSEKWEPETWDDVFRAVDERVVSPRVAAVVKDALAEVRANMQFDLEIRDVNQELRTSGEKPLDRESERKVFEHMAARHFTSFRDAYQDYQDRQELARLRAERSPEPREPVAREKARRVGSPGREKGKGPRPYRSARQLEDEISRAIAEEAGASRTEE